jgi:ribonuclease R
MKRDERAAALPSREEVVRWVEASEERVGKRDLLAAFAVRGAEKTALKRLIRELESEGALDLRRRRGRAPAEPAPRERLPAVGVVEVAAIDDNGDLLLRHPDLSEARILLPLEGLEGTAPGLRDRLLVKLYRQSDGSYEARVIRLLPRLPSEIVGVVEATGDGLRLRSADRKARSEFQIAPADARDAAPGDLVRAELLSVRRLGLPRARVLERLGRPEDPHAISLMIAVQASLPMTFPPEALALAARAEPVALGDRLDLRDVDLVTIDGEDARDFDDAVWAAPDDDPANPGGFRAVVAIADVAHYVRPGDALDRAARERGNSVYFPDRVLPMLPEALSNDLCSLRPEEDRACVAVELRIDRKGEVKAQRFARALMRSRARLTYTQVQRAQEGVTDEVTAPLLEPVIRPLYAAYAVLAAARHRRGTIELELPERQVVFDEAGQPAEIRIRERLPSHMLIEELMIAANVAAARTLEAVREPCMYRVHDKPDPLRLETLAQFLERLGVPWSRNAKKPGDFTRLLEMLKDHTLRDMIAGLVLRSQAQAVYQPRNIGHFGLNLKRYAHFTSPIRRYSDLLVHRALIRGLRLGAGGLPEGFDEAQMQRLGEHLSRCERRAMDAERRAVERYVAMFMASRTGAVFAGRVTSVMRFGLFVTLDETGAEGLLHVASLGDDAFLHDEHHHALVGQRYGETFALGDKVKVELVEADPITGELTFRLEEHEPGAGAELARQAWAKSGARRAGRRGAVPRSGRTRAARGR